MTDTIVAIATPSGTGGVGIIRLSGPQSWSIGTTLAAGGVSFQAGRIQHGWLKDPADGQVLDEVLFLPFLGPRSYTGEDVLEIHCHGGQTLVQTILKRCVSLGARPAEPGEFTRRAVGHGRLDLTQAEAVLDLIHAQGEALLKISAHNLQHHAAGDMIQRYAEVLTRIQADLTASIDFPDEVPEPDRVTVVQVLTALLADITDQMAWAEAHQVLRTGLEVVIAGRPNAGKSALFNALLTQERAIVTDIAGTTRDLLRETLSICGVPVTLVDTAGLRDTGDPVETMGVERTRQAMASAHAVLYVFDHTVGWTPDDHAVLETLPSLPWLLVANKSDLPTPEGLPATLPVPPVFVSAMTRAGLSRITDWLAQLPAVATPADGLGFLLSQRQLVALETVCGEIRDAAATLSQPAIPMDLATVPLTNALLALQSLLGHDTTERVLDSVFQRFCVGK